MLFFFFRVDIVTDLTLDAANAGVPPTQAQCAQSVECPQRFVRYAIAQSMVIMLAARGAIIMVIITI